MYDIELRIKPNDWLYILLIGMTLGSVFSAFIYIVLILNWKFGVVFGALLGFIITLFSLLFISIMNHSILPKVPQYLWMPFAIFFSFLSGFLGTQITMVIANMSHIVVIQILSENTLTFSFGIGFLTYIVGALLYRFVKMRNEKEYIDRHYIKSRLGSLERQLNPHFLFNALNSIAELVHQDPYKAEEAILQVSSFLRNTMNEKSLISLKEEIVNLKAYINVENIRFNGLITIELPDDIPKAVVPKFSLQLLAENAIKHGMINQKPLQIKIQYYPNENAVSIQNNGKSISKTTFGIGLNNLNERLELLCKGKLILVDTKKPCYKIYLGECDENIDRR